MNKFQSNHISKNLQRLGITARSMYNVRTDTHDILLDNGIIIDDYITAVVFVNGYAQQQPDNVRHLPDLVRTVMQEINGNDLICA
jgi:hypothetical protein